MEQSKLRNRKQSKANGKDQGVASEEDETSKLLRNDDLYDEEIDENDGETPNLFNLAPLIRRPLVMRLDVGPFLLAYAGLITFDSLEPMSPWTVWGVEPTTIALAATLMFHLTTVLLTQWSVMIKSDVGYYPASSSDAMDCWTHCLVQATHKELNGSVAAGIVPVLSESSNVTVVRFQDRTFRYCLHSPDADIRIWNPEKGVKQLAPHSLRFRLVSYPTNAPLLWYAEWKGHSTLPSATTAARVYGDNTTALQLPTFIELLSQQMIAPFFLFQVFCVVLWSLDEYWYYALFTLFALILFECILAYNRLKSLERLHDISRRNQRQRVWVRRGMEGAEMTFAWMSILVAELVPGDFVSLSGSHVNVPADILLLHGTAVCDEALLTGESVPQLKQPLDVTAASAHTRLDMQDGDHKESILFGGTVLLVGTPPTDPSPAQSGPHPSIIGVVLRTGFETAQGNLLRTMVHTSTSSDGVHTMDTFVFIFLLILFAIGAAAYVLQQGWHDERRNRFRLILHVVIILTSVVPPELPMELSLAVTNSVADLMKRCKVYCTEHFRIPWAGEVNVCCFDKTGTLTSDEMILRGVRLFDEGVISALSPDEEIALLHPEENDLLWETTRIMAACHSLAPMHNGSKNVVGDPLEKTVMQSTGYHLVGANVVTISPKRAARADCKPLQILHRFAFSSKLKRMTVLAAEIEGDCKIWALTKGAPETIKSLLSSKSIPDNFDSVAFHHMSRGRRVLAMAYRDVGRANKLAALKEGGRDKIEHELTFAGFLILDCPLKPDSKSVIAELHKSGHDVVMITGDAILTAAEVARRVGIIRRRSSSGTRTVYRIVKRENSPVSDSKDPLSCFECVDLSSGAGNDNSFVLSGSLLASWHMDAAREKISLCITGDTLVALALTVARLEETSGIAKPSSTLDEKNVLLNPSSLALLARLVPLISVFARHAPHQKEAVIAAFNTAGYQTLMCGDGTNDVGALKRAHIGISIISAPGVEKKQREASVAIARAKGSDKPTGSVKVKKPKAKTMEESLRRLREAQEELDQVELGDASVAAPFTSRAVSIKCCKDVLQQGRCTLVTMISIYKILGINCLVNALVLSKLFIHGGKQGDRQLTALGIGVAALFFFVTRAEPLSMLSPIRPPSSVLCRETFVSIMGQCFIHMATILLATEMALVFVDPYDPSLVPDGPFNPNVLNTCTFLLTCLSTINTFAINYRGRPFMKDLRENKLFYRSLQICYAVLAISTLEVFPPLNDVLQLTSATTLDISTDHDLFSAYPVVVNVVQRMGFPVFMASLMLLDTGASFGFERLVRQLFDHK